MSRVMELESWRPGAMEAVSSHESRAPAGAAAVAAPKAETSRTQAWDPYEVWRTRVKEPRDRRGRSTSR